MATGKGGYDYDFVDAPPKSLECPVCLLTLRDPHVISCCGHEFCQQCIGRVERDGKPCPLCNEPTFTTFLHKKLVREVNALVVHCPQKEVGCEWQGELGQLEQHLNPGAGVSSNGGCGYAMVECSYQCGAYLQRRKVQEHEVDICSKRPIEIQVASLMRKFEVITAENKLLRKELSEVKELHRKELNEVKQELSEVKKINKELLKAQQDVWMTCYELKKKQNVVQERCASLHTHSSPLPVPPFYFSVLNIDHCRKNNCMWRSGSFYSHPGGYKMFVIITPNGRVGYRGTHLSLAVCIQHGEFDDQLCWPFNGKVTVQVYDQKMEKWCYEKTIVLSEAKCEEKYVQKCVDRQSQGGWGYSDFISLSDLRSCVTSNGTTEFRVTKVEI